MLRKKSRLMFSLFRVKKTICAAVVLMMAFAFSAAQISLSSVNALTKEISTTPMTNAFILTFPTNGPSNKGLIALSEIFNGDYTIDGRLLSSGFYCIIQDEQPTLFGVKNMGDSTWFVQAEGRYFTENEIKSAQAVTVMSVSEYTKSFQIPQLYL